MSTQLDASKIGLSITQIRVDDQLSSKFDIWHCVGLARCGRRFPTLAAVGERGVVITTAPVLFDDVADLAVALALACCRQIPRAHRFVREGKWGRRA